HFCDPLTSGNSMVVFHQFRGVLCHLSRMHKGKGNAGTCTRTTAAACSREYNLRRSHATRGNLSERILGMRSYQNESELSKGETNTWQPNHFDTHGYSPSGGSPSTDVPAGRRRRRDPQGPLLGLRLGISTAWPASPGGAPPRHGAR